LVNIITADALLAFAASASAVIILTLHTEISRCLKQISGYAFLSTNKQYSTNFFKFSDLNTTSNIDANNEHNNDDENNEFIIKFTSYGTQI